MYDFFFTVIGKIVLALGVQQLDFKVEPSLVAAEQCPSPGIDILSMTHPCWLLGPFTGIASFMYLLALLMCGWQAGIPCISF